MIEAVMERLQEIKRLSTDSNQSSAARLIKIGKLIDEVFVEAKAAAKAEKKAGKAGGAKAGDQVQESDTTTAGGVVL